MFEKAVQHLLIFLHRQPACVIPGYNSTREFPIDAIRNHQMRKDKHLFFRPMPFLAGSN